MNKLRKPSLVARRVIRDFDICINPDRKKFYQFSQDSIVDGVIIALRDCEDEAADLALVKKITRLVKQTAPVWDGVELLEMSTLVKPGFLARWVIKRFRVQVSQGKKRFYWMRKGKIVPIHRAYIEQKILFLMGLESKTSIINDALRQIRVSAPVYHDVTDLSKNGNVASDGRRLRFKPDPNNAMSVAKWMEQDHNKSRVR